MFFLRGSVQKQVNNPLSRFCDLQIHQHVRELRVQFVVVAREPKFVVPQKALTKKLSYFRIRRRDAEKRERQDSQRVEAFFIGWFWVAGALSERLKDCLLELFAFGANLRQVVPVRDWGIDVRTLAAFSPLHTSSQCQQCRERRTTIAFADQPTLPLVNRAVFNRNPRGVADEPIFVSKVWPCFCHSIRMIANVQFFQRTPQRTQVCVLFVVAVGLRR